MSLTAQQLAALPAELATIPAAVHVPLIGDTFCCPRRTLRVHQCPDSFTKPDADQFAAYISETTGVEAYVLVYGVPWTA